MKKWVISKADADAVLNLQKKSNLTKICAEILVGRGYDTVKKASEFFFGHELSDPFKIKSMNMAVQIIRSSIENSESICIYGDYDCDGVISTVILFSYLQCAGADIRYYIPERKDGYGLNIKSIKALYDAGVALIITVDNGISAAEEISYAKSLGMKVVVTDHHSIPEVLPPADAIIDLKQKDCSSSFKHLCGAGVVLKLVAALDGGDCGVAIEQFSDLAGIATVADIVELSGENRLIADSCLHYIKNTENLGLSALIEASGLKHDNITSTDIAFVIAPRINAAGRFGSAMLAVELLLCEDEEQAEELALKLCDLNQQRKNCEAQILLEIEQIINDNPSILNERVLIFSKENWHCGVIGIISAKITERFGKPSFIISVNENEARGSARGIDGFSVYNTLSSVSSLLTHFGGHTGAGGFSLLPENLEKFKENILLNVKNAYNNMPSSAILADKVLLPEDITIENVKSLLVFEPHGDGNKKPIFAVLGAKIVDVLPLSGGKHTKIKINYSGIILDMLMFGTPTQNIMVHKDDVIDALVNLEINTFNDRSSVIARALDYRLHGINQPKYFSAKEAYESYCRCEEIAEPLYSRILPSREELLHVYKYVQKGRINADALFSRMNYENINFCKLKLCLDILEELELINIDRFNDIISSTDLKKADLNNSVVLNKLKQKCLAGGE